VAGLRFRSAEFRGAQVVAGLAVLPLLVGLTIGGGAGGTSGSSRGRLGFSVGAPHYRLVDLSQYLPAGYADEVPIAINVHGEVAGEVMSSAVASPSPFSALAAVRARLTAVFATEAGPQPVPHVFVYYAGHLTVLPTAPGVTQAWVAGLNDAGDLAVVTCAADCNHYFVVRQVSGSFIWTALGGANGGLGGLGPIADDGDVAGAIVKHELAVPVLWRLTPKGTYGPPEELGVEASSQFARIYVPDAILSRSPRDLEGGVENTINFYPSGTPVLWGPKIAHDPGFIGSQTMALGGAPTAMVAAVGGSQPVPVCGPACPIDPVVYDVAVPKGVPIVSDKRTLQAPRVPHCGVSPYGVTIDPHQVPVTVGQAALVDNGNSSYVPEAVIWLGSRLFLLDSAIKAPARTDLQSANAIDSPGWIVGTGQIAGKTAQAFLLEPTYRW